MISLRALTILFLSAFAATVALAGYLTFTASSDAAVASVDRRIEAVGDALLTGARPGDANGLLRRIAVFVNHREHGDIGFELKDASGRRLGGNVRVARPLPLGLATLNQRDRLPGLVAGRAHTRDAGGGLRLTTIAETEPIDGYTAARIRNYLLGFGAIILVVALGTAIFGWIVRQRIADVGDTARAIIGGDLRRRVPVDRTAGVFADQAAVVNQMLDRIEGLVEGIRNVSSEVAHDLRRPMARLRSRLSALAEAPHTAALPDELEAALADCDALLQMFAAILRIAEVDGGERRAHFATIDLAAVAQDVCAALGEAAPESGHALVAGPFEPVAIRGDRQLLSQAVFNLVENALHHTPAGGTIRVTTRRADATATLCVRDEGPGIAEPDRALALRRFGRLERSRTQPGHGLGLPLVAAIARLHDGRLTLADAEPGLAASLIFPTGARAA